MFRFFLILLFVCTVYGLVQLAKRDPVLIDSTPTDCILYDSCGLDGRGDFEPSFDVEKDINMSIK